MANDVPSLKTAAKTIRYLGSAKSGVAAARAMHLTSVALIPLTVAFVWILARIAHMNRDPHLSAFAAAQYEISRTCPAILMLLFVGASIWHMQLGMKVIIDDYVHGRHLKEWALIANILLCVVLGIACAYALLRVSYGAPIFRMVPGTTF